MADVFSVWPLPDSEEQVGQQSVVVQVPPLFQNTTTSRRDIHFESFLKVVATLHVCLVVSVGRGIRSQPASKPQALNHPDRVQHFEVWKLGKLESSFMRA